MRPGDLLEVDGRTVAVNGSDRWPTDLAPVDGWRISGIDEHGQAVIARRVGGRWTEAWPDEQEAAA